MIVAHEKKGIGEGTYDGNVECPNGPLMKHRISV